MSLSDFNGINWLFVEVSVVFQVIFSKATYHAGR